MSFFFLFIFVIIDYKNEGKNMNKKKKFSYKNLKVNEEELSITKIGEMPNENKSPIFLVFVFGLLLVFIFFLPEIVSYFSGKDSNLVNNPVVDNKEKSTSDEKEDIVYYTINDALEINLENGIKLNQFKINNDSISFSVTNSKDVDYNFNKKNYFMELYTEEQTLLERVILEKDSISKKNSKEYSYSLLTSTIAGAKKIVFIEKQVDDYPNITLTKNEAGEQILVCKKDFETLSYTFKEDKLQKITDAVNYARSGNELNYQLDFSLWQSRVNNYNAISGITSTFMSNDTGFMVNTVLDLENVKNSSMDNDTFYKYETLAKVVDFEMKARGFDCK